MDPLSFEDELRMSSSRNDCLLERTCFTTSLDEPSSVADVQNDEPSSLDYVSCSVGSWNGSSTKLEDAMRRKVEERSFGVEMSRLGSLVPLRRGSNVSQRAPRNARSSERTVYREDLSTFSCVLNRFRSSRGREARTRPTSSILRKERACTDFTRVARRFPLEARSGERVLRHGG